MQDAFGTPGASTSLTTTSPEIVALDAIGYNLVTTVTTTPEPRDPRAARYLAARLGRAASSPHLKPFSCRCPRRCSGRGPTGEDIAPQPVSHPASRPSQLRPAAVVDRAPHRASASKPMWPDRGVLSVQWNAVKICAPASLRAEGTRRAGPPTFNKRRNSSTKSPSPHPAPRAGPPLPQCGRGC